MTESGEKKGRLKVLYDLSDVKIIIYTEPVLVGQQSEKNTEENIRNSQPPVRAYKLQMY